MKTKNKLTKKLLSVLAVAMVCTTSLVPAFAYAEDTAGDTAKSNQPTAATKEVATTSPSITTQLDGEDANTPEEDNGLAVSVKGNGSVTFKKVNAAESTRQAVLSSENKKLDVKKGDTVEVVTYALDGNAVSADLKGIEKVSEKQAAKNNKVITYKLTEDSAKISLTFSGGASLSNRSAIGVQSEGGIQTFASSSVSATVSLSKYQYGYDAGGSSYYPNMYGLFSSSAGYKNAIYCGEHDRTATVGTYTATKFTDETMRKIVYYGYKGPKQWSGFASSTYNGPYQLWGSNTDKTEICGTIVTSQALSNRYNSLGGAGTNVSPSGLSAFMSYVNSQPDPGASWTLYRIKASGQDMFFGKYVPNGYLKLTKSVASDKALVAECPNTYSLAGAKYTVKNASGTVVGTLTTTATGGTNKLSLPVGTYTVKETTAPKGFALDKKTYTATIAESATVTLKSSEVPLFDPISIVLNKTADGESYLNPGNMEGAEFEIKYYDTVNDDLSGSSMTRTWKLKTIKAADGKYVAGLRKDYILDGSDELFMDENGTVVVPRGIITIKETKAPKGYKVDTTVYKYKIEKDPDGTVQNMVFNFGATPDQPNKPLVPSIKTTAADAATEDGAGRVDKDITIKDTVSYKELSEGETYTIKGTLMDKETGEPLLVDGKEITAEKTFTVTKENSTIDGNGAAGTVDLEFTLNSSALAGKTTVVFEKLFYDDKEIAVHEDIEDEGQSVHFPDIKTTATAEESKDHQGTPSENETLTDVVKYTNLIPGKEYTIKGTLMDKESNSAILDKDGKEVTAEKTFTPDTADGEVSITFTYDSSLRQGHSTVVFEDLYHNDVKLTSHADIEDKDQTIDYPDIKTTAAVATTSTDTHGKFEMVRIVDVVKYTNLIPGKEYVVKGKLMDKTTGEPLIINDKEVTAETKFTAKTVNGKAYLNYEFDAKEIAGKTVVVFEDLYYNDFKIATHSDIEDNDQTVRYPTLRTKAAITNEGSIESTGKAHITDVVYYTNLVPGKTYTVKGTLMDKKDNKPFVAGGKVVTATKTFTPENPSGEVNIDFVFDAKDIQGETVVAFENMYQNNVLVGTHSDINDKAQTVTFGSNPKTGDNAKIPMACAALLGAALVAILIAKKKRK